MKHYFYVENDIIDLSILAIFRLCMVRNKFHIAKATASSNYDSKISNWTVYTYLFHINVVENWRYL